MFLRNIFKWFFALQGGAASQAGGCGGESVKVVSQQSTARPGCLIELDSVADATQDWKNIQLIHVFQEQLITAGAKGSSGAGSVLVDGQKKLEPIVNLQHDSVFEEVFYLVVIEKMANGTPLLHMWRLVIASQGSFADLRVFVDLNGVPFLCRCVVTVSPPTSEDQSSILY